MAVNLTFLSDGFSTVISGNTFAFKITLREPVVLMIKRDDGLLEASSFPLEDRDRRSFNRSCPRPRSTHDDVDLSNKYS